MAGLGLGLIRWVPSGIRSCIFPALDMPDSTTEGDLNSHTLADYDCLIKFLALGKF